MKHLKYFVIMAAMLLAAISASAAETVRKTYDLKGFTGLEISWMFEVEVIRSDNWSVEIEVSDDVLEYIEVKVWGDQLHLGADRIPKSLTNLRNWLPTAKAVIHMPELSQVSMSGATRFNSPDTFKTKGTFKVSTSGASKILNLSVNADKLDMQCSGATNFTVSGDFDKAEMQMSGAAKGTSSIRAKSVSIKSSGAHEGEYDFDCKQLDLDCSGAAKIKVSGEADNVDIDCSGACDINLLKAEVNKAGVELSGAAKCQIKPSESLTVELSGASTCRYAATPGLDLNVISLSRGSSLTKIK